MASGTTASWPTDAEKGKSTAPRVSEMRRVHRKGWAAMIGAKIKRPAVLTTGVVRDLQTYARPLYMAAAGRGDDKAALGFALLSWFSALQGLVGYRPGDILNYSRADWIRTKVKGGHRVIWTGALRRCRSRTTTSSASPRPLRASR